MEKLIFGRGPTEGEFDKRRTAHKYQGRTRKIAIDGESVGYVLEEIERKLQ